MRAGDLQAVLVNNPSVAAEVARICMLGLATTVHATRGPPKPDKARIDRLAYVVSTRPFPHTPLCHDACPAHTQRVGCCLGHTSGAQEHASTWLNPVLAGVWASMSPPTLICAHRRAL